MKLVGFCLFALCCYFSLANSSRSLSNTTLQRKKLVEVYRQLKLVKQDLQHSEQLLNTPPSNVEDCCCLSALQCYRDNLNKQFKATQKSQKILYRSLRNPLTERGLNFCNSRSVNSTCQDCDSHPKENVREFFNRLESLIQKAIDRLSEN